MDRKRKEEDKHYLLKKLRRLEKKISALPDSDDEVREIEEGEIYSEKENDLPEEVFLENLDIEDEIKENELEDEVLNILGVAPAPAPKKENLHQQIAERWCEILDKGIKKEEKEEICRENPPFENVRKMTAPKLNKEVSAALNDNAKRRDQVIENRQKQMSTALACVGQALQMCIDDKQEKRLSVIKKLNQASRLLCDSIFLETKGRRTLVLSSINKDLKDSLLETDSTDFLFGENLTEKIKTAKAVQKSGKELKAEDRKKIIARRTEVSAKGENNRALNWRGPPRMGAQQRFQRSGGPTFNRQAQANKKPEDKPTLRRGKK